MGQTIPLDALGNFEALPIFREIISRGDTGLSVSGFDLGLDDKAVNGLKCHGVVGGHSNSPDFLHASADIPGGADRGAED